MNTKTPNTLLLLLALAECNAPPPHDPSDVGVADTTTGPDLPATDGQETGWMKPVAGSREPTPAI